MESSLSDWRLKLSGNSKMDNKVRLQCCLNWVAGMLPPDHSAIPLLLNPGNSEGELPYEVVLALTDPSLYSSIVSSIHTRERPLDFASILHTLARYGVYILEDGETAVNDSVLSQLNPFNQASHVALIEGLMTLYTQAIVTVPQIVKTVRRISELLKLVASKELPTSLEEGLMLWLNKVSLFVMESRRRARPNQSLSLDQKLCALLVYYDPSTFKVADFHFGPQPLTKQHHSENVKKVIDFLKPRLGPPGFHLDSAFLMTQQNGFLLHISALIANIYAYFELNIRRSLTEMTCDFMAGKTRAHKSHIPVVSELQSSSDTVLTEQKRMRDMTVFKAPVKSSLSKTLAKTQSSHELITFSTQNLVESSVSQPRVSISRTKRTITSRDEEELKRSFTVDTHQTLPSALAAGLPVIKSEELLGDESSKFNEAPKTQKEQQAQSLPKTGSIEIAETPKVTVPALKKSRIVLNIFPDDYGNKSPKGHFPQELSNKLITAYERAEAKLAQQQEETLAIRLRIFEALPGSVKGPEAISKTSSLSEFPFSPITPVKSSNTQDHVICTPDHVIPKAQAIGHQPSVTYNQSPVSELNPWSKPSQPIPTQDEMERQNRERIVKARLEQRERDRKATQDHRRRAQASERVPEELNRAPTASAGSSVVADGQKFTEIQAEYNGPTAYVPPKAKSNKKLVKNAISYVCLAGDANLTVKKTVLDMLDSSSSTHFMVLFRDIIGFKFRGIYSFSLESNQATKIHGSGPKTVTARMVAHLYKYNSGRKEFKEIPSRTISLSADAMTIHSEYWAKKSKPHK